MPRHNHVGEGEQALKDIIGNDRAGEVAEKQISFLLVNIKGEAAELAAFQGLDRRFVSIRPPRLVLTSKAPRLARDSVSALTM